MKALTIDAPWAWAIIAGHKRVENRSWATKHRGELAIHAGRSTRSDAEALALFAWLGIVGPTPDDLDALRGCVLGVVDVVAMVTQEDGLFAAEMGVEEFGPWWFGPVGWVLQCPRPCEPFQATGQLSLWTLDGSGVSELERSIRYRQH